MIHTLHRYWRTLSQLVIPKHLLAREVDAARRAEFLLALVMIVTVIGLMRIATLLVQGVLLETILTVTFLLLQGGLLWFLRRVGSVFWAGNALAALYFVAISGATYLYGGLGTPLLMVLGLPSLLATFVAGWRSGLVWALMTLAEACAYAFWGHMLSPPQGPSAVHHVLDVASFVALLLAAAMAYEMSRSVALEVRRRAETESARAAAEAHMVRADRMASVGQLAAAVAHEINTPLGYVSANLAFIESRLNALRQADGARCELTRRELLELLGAISDAREGTERVAAIVRDLKCFARLDDNDELAPVDLRQVMDTAIKMAETEIRHRAHLERRYDDVPAVQASASRLSQVFLNLLVNAAQAIPDGEADRHSVTATIELDPDGRVVAEVRDTGAGIPPDILERVTEPFFTTKPAGVGTGLGLSVSRRIVESHDGQMQIESEFGRGTAVRVLFEAAGEGEHAEAPRHRTDPASQPHHRYRILVVDDDHAFLRAIRRMLRAHDVTVMSSAREALIHLQSHKSYDVILCDLMIPGMSGVDLYERLSEFDPSVCERMVFLTGGAFTARARSFLDRVPNITLEKPLVPGQFERLVENMAHPRQALERSSSAHKTQAALLA